MELAFLVYGISLLTGINVLFSISIVASAAILIGYLIYHLEPNGDSYVRKKEEILTSRYYNEDSRSRLLNDLETNKKNGVFRIRAAIASLVIAAMGIVFTPSEKTAWIMVGAYAAQKVVTSPGMQDTGNKIVTIINNKLDSFITEGVKK